jgi:hypothetical protein
MIVLLLPQDIDTSRNSNGLPASANSAPLARP